MKNNMSLSILNLLSILSLTSMLSLQAMHKRDNISTVGGGLGADDDGASGAQSEHLIMAPGGARVNNSNKHAAKSGAGAGAGGGGAAQPILVASDNTTSCSARSIAAVAAAAAPMRAPAADDLVMITVPWSTLVTCGEEKAELTKLCVLNSNKEKVSERLDIKRHAEPLQRCIELLQIQGAEHHSNLRNAILRNLEYPKIILKREILNNELKPILSNDVMSIVTAYDDPYYVDALCLTMPRFKTSIETFLRYAQVIVSSLLKNTKKVEEFKKLRYGIPFSNEFSRHLTNHGLKHDPNYIKPDRFVCDRCGTEISGFASNFPHLAFTRDPKEAQKFMAALYHKTGCKFKKEDVPADIDPGDLMTHRLFVYLPAMNSKGPENYALRLYLILCQLHGQLSRWKNLADFMVHPEDFMRNLSR